MAPSISASPSPKPPVRESREESGIECAIAGVVEIYSDLKHAILYTSNGEARQEFSIVLTARPLAGQPTPGAGQTNEDNRR